ncbi:MAG: DNA repair protein RecO, partial [Desulfovibrionaceae bacterium]|nr:DNA repair protein RecO [Desulfovibrionaceae bacterium]
MEWTDTALVLRVGRFRETDLWLRLLSCHRGVFSAFAFGGSRSRRRFCGCLDLLNTVSCRVKSTRNGSYLALQEGVLIRGPRRLRSDWRRLGIAMNCARFLETLGVTREGASAAFALLEDVLELMEGESSPHPLFPLFFRLRLASEQGFAPTLDKCGICGTRITAPGRFI